MVSRELVKFCSNCFCVKLWVTVYLFLFQVGLLSQVNIEEQPKLALLRKSEEDWAEFSKVTYYCFFVAFTVLITEFVSINIVCEQAPK